MIEHACMILSMEASCKELWIDRLAIVALTKRILAVAKVD